MPYHPLTCLLAPILTDGVRQREVRLAQVRRIGLEAVSEANRSFIKGGIECPRRREDERGA